MTIKKQLGRLQKITDLREVWDHEAQDFTPWLAEKNNLDLLGDTIGIEMELESVEQDVGPYRADIVCKDTADGSYVLIENQLNKTDHSHLGQILTYAAGLKAVTIVWIASRFTDEHQATIEWLNDMTGDGLNLFGLEVELWKIGDSLIAPKFNIAARPNTWTKGGGNQPLSETQLTKGKQLQLDFWTAFREFIMDHSTPLKPRKPQPQAWYDFAIGKAGFWLSAIASLYSEEGGYSQHELRAEFGGNTPVARQKLAALEENHDDFDERLGEKLTWHMPEGTKQWRAFVRRDADLNNRDEWPIYFAWFLKKLELLRNEFRPLIADV
jgi:hypothetical protein